MKPYRVAVDIGGTFVDAIEFDRESQTIRVEKASTTPQEPWRGVLDALDKLGTDLGQAELFIHGTTLGINAILLALIIGLLASVYPAIMAARLDPNTALRTL